MYVFGEYNRYSPTQSVTAYVNNGTGEALSGFTTIEGGWSKLVFKFSVPTAGTIEFRIEINSTTVDSGLSISGIQIVKQSGLIVSDGTNTNNQLITPFGSYTTGSLYNNGSIINYGAFKNYGPLSLFLPYSSGSLVIGSSSYGMNISDKGKYNVLIGAQVAAAATPTQALNMNSCVAIGYAALEQGGLSTNGISRCTGVGYQANRWNATHLATSCDDNCGVGYQSGAGLGYSDTNSARNCTFGNYVLAGAYGDSNDNSVFGFNSMSSYTASGRSFNSCLGGSSLINCVSNYNSCLGYGSAANMINTSSSYNTFVGAQVCPSQTNSTDILTNCSFFGAKTDVIYSGNYSNSTCLGYNSRIEGNNGIFLGTATELTYAMGGLVIPLDRGLILDGNIIANYSTITPTQISYLNDIYINNASTYNITFGTGVAPIGGTQNIAIGSGCMLGDSTVGSNNLGIGLNSLGYLESGNENCAISVASLASLVGGSYNTVCGVSAGSNQINTNHNSFFGRQAGNNNFIFNYCSAFGSGSGFTANVDYSTAIGYGVTCNASNQIKLGRTSETTVIDGSFNMTNSPIVLSGANALVAGSTNITSTQLGYLGSLTAGIVSLAGAQSISGIKTFNSAPVMSGGSISSASIPDSALSSNVGLLTGTQTFSGTKSFTGGITASGTQTITFGTNAPTMYGNNIAAATIPNSALQSSVILSSGSQTLSGGKTFTGGITASGTQTITFGTNAPTMSGGGISAASIPDAALSANIPLLNGTNTFTAANAINNQYVHAAYGSVITAAATLTSLSSIIYEYYSVSAGASAYTITLPTITSSNVGQLITFRRVGGTTTTIISLTGNGTQLIYNTQLTGLTTATLLGSGIYTVKLVGLLVTGTTYAYFQI